MNAIFIYKKTEVLYIHRVAFEVVCADFSWRLIYETFNQKGEKDENSNGFWLIEKKYFRVVSFSEG